MGKNRLTMLLCAFVLVAASCGELEETQASTEIRDAESAFGEQTSEGAGDQVTAPPTAVDRDVLVVPDKNAPSQPDNTIQPNTDFGLEPKAEESAQAPRQQVASPVGTAKTESDQAQAKPQALVDENAAVAVVAASAGASEKLTKKRSGPSRRGWKKKYKRNKNKIKRRNKKNKRATTTTVAVPTVGDETTVTTSNGATTATSSSPTTGKPRTTTSTSAGSSTQPPTSGSPGTRPSTSSSTSAPVTTPVTSGSTAPPPPPPPPLPVSGNTVFFEDFSSNNSLSRFDFDVYHRDDSLVRVTSWPGDHVSTGPNDLCGPPTEKRTVQRGERSQGFNDEWIYRCVPGGDTGKAHLMTTIGATSGYSIGAFTPKQSFNNIREIRWDVNQTDLGARQWTELVLIPTNQFNFQNLPCVTGLPCSTVTHADVGSVGTHWAGTRARNITTAAQPAGYTETSGPRGYRFPGSSRENSMRFGEDYGVNDPALTSIKIRRQNYFRDNGNGTLSWGYQLQNGTFQEMTAPGSFPSGNLKVVFKDHNYTPLKSPSILLPETTFTWHWDNIQILN